MSFKVTGFMSCDGRVLLAWPEAEKSEDKEVKTKTTHCERNANRGELRTECIEFDCAF